MADELKAVQLVLLNTMELWPNTVVVASYNAAVQHDVGDKFVLTLDSKLAVASVESEMPCHKAHALFIWFVCYKIESMFSECKYIYCTLYIYVQYHRCLSIVLISFSPSINFFILDEFHHKT